MAIVINGTGSIAGLSVGGLPDDTVDEGSLANSINTSIGAKLPLAGGTMTGNLQVNGTFKSRSIDDTDNSSGTAITIYDSEEVKLHNMVEIHTAKTAVPTYSAIRLQSPVDAIGQLVGQTYVLNGVSGRPRAAIFAKAELANGYGASLTFMTRSAEDGSTLNATGDIRMTIKSDGKIGIGTPTPQTEMHVVTANTSLVHIGGTANANGNYQGISLGYAEAGNTNYRKVAVVSAGLNDGAGRQAFHVLVDTAADAGSTQLADSKFSVNGTTGICQARNGLTFGTDSAAANALDDYEEGTWTAIIRGSTGSAGSAAQNSSTGHYIKVGNLVQVSFEGYMTNKGSWSGNARIYGLPYTVGYVSTGSLASFPSTAVDAAMRAVNIPANNSYIVFKKGSKLDVAVPFSEIVTGYYFSVSATYRV